MREILFRGKRLDNGEWVEGYFAHFITCKQGKESYRIYSRYAELDCGDFYPDFWEVDPNSIRQYTGLTDKNGNKIFEGDVVRNKKCFGSEIGLVEFRKGEFLIQGQTPNIVESTYYGFWQVERTIEVIGNIHDNPELFEDKR